MIVLSTVLNTAAKVKEIYGGTTWTQISGRFLLAANSTYAVKSTGGTTTHVHTTGNHTLTASEIPAHTHGKKSLTGQFAVRKAEGNNNTVAAGSGIVSIVNHTSKSVPFPLTTGDLTMHKVTIDTSHEHTSVGSGGAHNHGNTGSSNTFPAYYAVYIWERTA